METYRILISNFDEEIQSFEISWMDRNFRWEGKLPGTSMHDYLSALAANTRKPPAICLTLAAKYLYPDSSVTVMTPEQVAKADAASE